ncbi:hypothetical protein BDZ89DRAFT_555830 [Hymenopellis radicata]|nr:hypothetical protein BDZ89DRAFT_555830 [Hymenopellis radicata]
MPNPSRHEEEDSLDSRIPSPLDRVPFAHRIGPSPSGGLGMFATRPLKAGDLILLNAPGSSLHLKGKDKQRLPSSCFYMEQEKTLD